MASVQNIGVNGERIKADNERMSLPTGMSKETPLNKSHTRESYWFAHSRTDDISPGNVHSDSKTAAEVKDMQLQRDREEKMRIFREHQEEERLRKLREMEQQFLQAKRHREQQEEERRRRIEEARLREIERRQQVEERKRQIWEAEQERKEAILRRNMEREARIEARRNAQRNSQSFAFGSSTPRTFDLDLAAIGSGSVLMSSVGRKSEERDLGPPRATSACSLDRKFGEDCMSRSMVSLSSSSAFRGRKRTDITPIMTRERSITPHITPRGNQSMRAVSMTRLDQLAQPRRPYPRNLNNNLPTPTTQGGPRTVSPSMSKSMCNLANSSGFGKRTPRTLLSRNGNSSISQNSPNSMSKSMLHLADSAQKDNRQLSPSPTFPKSGMRSAQSMMHLAVAPPRLTRAARLRAQALASNRAMSAWNLNKTSENCVSSQYLTPGKDTSRSPSRPQSSMSGTSDISASSSSASAANMRHRPAPRRPRPYSVAGTVSLMSQSMKQESFDRQPRMNERNAVSQKPQRAKSACREEDSVKNSRPLSAPKKPVPPPKTTELLARAKSHPVPIKDNLRKVGKNVNNSLPANQKTSTEEKHKVNVQQDVTNKIECKRKETSPEPNIPNPDVQLNSTVTSPTTDSEILLVSSDDSLGQFTNETDYKMEDSSICATSVSPTVSSEETNDSERTTQNEEPAIQDNLSQALTEKEEKQQMQIKTEKDDKQQAQTKIEKEEKQQVQTNITLDSPNKEFLPSKPRITSEEEARAALAEKRRLAREQAEREAELERQRLEEIRRKEEEQRRLEEEEQRRMEEEQMRLAELHRRLEEEKLARAIEEQRQREKEEQERREEEARLKAEKEEQEKKSREEAEKQRIELEEKLRKEEEERAERKRRVEQIMARTRGKTTAQSPSGSQNESIVKSIKNIENSINLTTSNPMQTAESNISTEVNSVPNIPAITNGIMKSTSVQQNSSMNGITENHVWRPADGLPDLLSNTSEIVANHSLQRSNGPFVGIDEQLSKISISSNFTNRTLSANDDTSPQTNGYSSHEEMSCTTSPEENADLLINIQSCEQRNSADFTKLVDVEPPSLDNNVNNDNYLIEVDDVNSNLFSSFADTVQKKQDTPVTDLLS